MATLGRKIYRWLLYGLALLAWVLLGVRANQMINVDEGHYIESIFWYGLTAFFVLSLVSEKYRRQKP